MVLFWFYFSRLSNRIVRINIKSPETGASLSAGKKGIKIYCCFFLLLLLLFIDKNILVVHPKILRLVIKFILMYTYITIK